MLANIILAGALALTASAAPVALSPRAPVATTGSAFRLVAKVRSSSSSSPSAAAVNNLELAAYHTSPSLNRGALAASSATVFYQNGTQAQRDTWTATLVNDTPSFPQGFVIDFEGSGGATGNLFEVQVNAGPGSQSVMISSEAQEYAFVDRQAATGGFQACVDSASGTTLVDWYVLDGAAEGCVAIDLVPECMALPELPEGSTWNHEFVQQVRCYEDVSAIEWR